MSPSAVSSLVTECSSSLIELDTTHFTTLHPAWVDILAMSGQELFVIDGDSLISYVLQDSTLQLAKTGDPSYQLLHATYLIEHLLHQLIKRDCIFDVVFFNSESTHRPIQSLLFLSQNALGHT